LKWRRDWEQKQQQLREQKKQEKAAEQQSRLEQELQRMMRYINNSNPLEGRVGGTSDWFWSPERKRYYRYENNVQGDFSLPLSELLRAYVLYCRIVNSL
jgi:type II secretory pathway pseudopilin PulG